MTNGTLIKTALTALAILVPVLLMACGDGDKELSRADVAEIVRSELAEAPASADPGPSREEIEQIVSAAIADIPERDSGPTGIEAGPTNGSAAASIPPKSTPGDYTRFFVNKAISRYGSEGLGATLAYHNTNESVDGQWYMFIIDNDNVMVAHAANPNLVGRPASAAMGPNSYPAGAAVAAVADEDGAWFDYTFPNPATGGAETKHSWTVRHDGLVFTSGWYERGPRKSDAPAYTKAFVQQALNLYDALGKEAAVAYYSTNESVDGQWYVFIVDQDGFTIAHHNPMFMMRDPSLRVDATGYFYGDDLLSATEAGHWVDYVLLNPESGGDQQKHTWIVRHDGLLFASGWYEK